MSLMRKTFLWAAAATAVMVPVDVLAVYWVTPAVRGNFSKDLSAAFSFDAQTSSAPLAAYKELMAQSSLFGNVVVPMNTLVVAKGTQITNIALKGILSLNGRTAIFEDRDTRRTYFAQGGDTVRNWTVKELAEDAAVLTDGANEIKLKIEENQK